MAISQTDINDTLTLTINNGDRETLQRILETYNFRNYESFLRFVSSIMTDAQDRTLFILRDSVPMKVSPAQHLLNQEG